MRCTLVVGLLLLILTVVPAAASAQEEEVPLETASQLADASYTRDVGAGLTLGGMGVTALGVGLMFGIGGFENWSGLIAGGLFEGIGGLLALIGIPTWIVGGVRSDVLSRAEGDRMRVAWGYELAGMVTTLASIGMCLVGGGLLLGGLIGANGSRSVHDGETYNSMAMAGVVMVPVGYFIATFIGAPLWSEGARF
jgi:hypothetical protein